MIKLITPDRDQTNLASFARASNSNDQRAARIIVGLFKDFYEQAVPQMDAASFKPLSFRNGSINIAIEKLADSDASGQRQLTVLKSALGLEAKLLEGTPLVPVLPDLHHWCFVKDKGQDDFTFSPSNNPVILAWPELRYAGVLSNPHDPAQEGFDEDFVLDPVRLEEQSRIIAEETGLDQNNILKTVFVNSAHVLGRRIVHGTNGQVGPSYWVALANTAQYVLDNQP